MQSLRYRLFASLAILGFASIAVANAPRESFDADDVAAANTLVQTLSVTDWLGPMAPLALSPFFGVTVLSGLSLYGPDWATNNPLLSSSSALNNEVLFFAFLGLTIATSLPRFSKVSKPLAQALDQLETYSVIVIIVAIKMFASWNSASGETPPVAMIQLGIVSVSADVLLSTAMIINMVVINTVRFFFEFLVWLTPFPAVDAIFEACNKSLCAALLAIYAFSPMIATVINLIVLVAAAFIFKWASRQVRFYRTMLLDPLVAMFSSGYSKARSGKIIVFSKKQMGPFPAKSRLALSQAAEGQWQLESAEWFGRTQEFGIQQSDAPRLDRGWLMHAITTARGDLVFSRRYDRNFKEVIQQLGLSVSEHETRSEKTHVTVAGEFA